MLADFYFGKISYFNDLNIEFESKNYSTKKKNFHLRGFFLPIYCVNEGVSVLKNVFITSLSQNYIF